jgi:hypothetical protein
MGCHSPIADPKRWSGCAAGAQAEAFAGAQGEAAVGGGAHGDAADGAAGEVGARCPAKKSKSLDTLPPKEWRVDLRRLAVLA